MRGKREYINGQRPQGRCPFIDGDDVDALYDAIAGIFDSIDTLGHDKKKELDFDASVPYHAVSAKRFSGKEFTPYQVSNERSCHPAGVHQNRAVRCTGIADQVCPSREEPMECPSRK